MSIDIISYEPTLSGSSVKKISQKSPFRGSGFLIDDIASALSQAGWSLTDSFYAVGGISFPVIIPVKAPVSGTITVKHPSFLPFATISGVKFDYYDPANETPLLSANVTWFALGVTQYLTALNFANVISSSTSYDSTAFWDGAHASVNLVAKSPGPLYNFPVMSVNAHWGTSAIPAGGGWEYTATNSESVYKVKMIAETIGLINLFHPGVNFEGNVRFTFTFHTGLMDVYIAPYPLDFQPLPFFTILANQHSLMIFDPISPASRDQVSLMAFAPHRTGPSYCVAVIGNRTITDQTSFKMRAGMKIALDANPVDVFDVRLLSMRTPGVSPLIDLGGMPPVTGAYVFMGTPVESVVGKLYDCVVLNDKVNDVIFEGVNYTRIGSQDGSSGRTRTSLLWRA